MLTLQVHTASTHYKYSPYTPTSTHPTITQRASTHCKYFIQFLSISTPYKYFVHVVGTSAHHTNTHHTCTRHSGTQYLPWLSVQVDTSTHSVSTVQVLTIQALYKYTVQVHRTSTPQVLSTSTNTPSPHATLVMQRRRF